MKKNKNILIVDDRFCLISNPLLSEIINAAKDMGEINIDFTTVSTKAIEMLRAGEYDLVLMDGEFDNCALQGPEAVREIRKFSNIPILMISGLTSMRDEGIANGANDWIKKYEILKELEDENGKIRNMLALR